MSSHRRRKHQTQANTVSSPTTGTNSTDTLERAKEAVYLLEGSDATPGRFREAWQKFRQAYENAVNKNSNPDTHKHFPVWALSQFDPGYLEDFLTAGYSQDLKLLRLCAPSASTHFKVRPWLFILYFDYIERARAKAINEISVKHPSLTFNQLYEEVQRNHLKRIKRHKDPKYEFLPRDFRACLKESDNVSSNAQRNNSFDGTEQRIVKREERSDSDNPENDHPAPAALTDSNDREGDSTAGHDDQDDDLEELSDLINNATQRSIPTQRPIPSTIINRFTRTRNKAYAMNGYDDLESPIRPRLRAGGVTMRRELSHEPSSPSNPLSDEGIFSSNEEQLFQEERSTFLDYEQFKASLKKAIITTEACLKNLEEESAAYAEEATQVLSNRDSFYEDMHPKLNRISYRMGNNNKKRKNLEDGNEKRKKLVAELENPEIQAYFKNISQ